MIHKTSIIIPSYKEKENLKKIIPLICKRLSTKEFIFEIIVVDDNSKDGTKEVFRKIKKNFKNVKLFVRKNKFRDLLYKKYKKQF
jgi:dolichol-phosphate mannosyltransferase